MKAKHFITFFSLIVIALGVFSQRVDTTQAHQLVQIAVQRADSSKWEQAAKILEKALPVYQEGKYWESTARYLHQLGVYCYKAGMEDITVEYLEEAKNISQTRLETPNVLEIEIYRSLGKYYEIRKGDYQQSFYAYNTAFQIAEKILDPQEELYIDAMASLGNGYSNLGQFDKSNSLRQEVLKKYKSLFGDTHYKVVNAYNNLAVDYLYQGDNQTAYKILQEVLPYAEKLDPEHIMSTILIYMNMGNACSGMGYYDRSIEYAEKAMKITPRDNLYNKSTYAGLLLNISGGHQWLGNYRKAIDYIQEAYNLKSELLGEDHPEVALALQNLGIFYTDIGAFEEGRYFLNQAMKICEDMDIPNQPMLADIYQSIGNTYVNYNQVDHDEKALSYYSKAIEINLATERWYHLAMNYVNTGAVYRNQEDYEAASRFYEKFRKTLMDAYGASADQSPVMYTYYHNLADIRLRRGESTKAITPMQKGIELMKMQLGEVNPELSKSYTLLAEIFGKTGNYEDAFRSIDLAFYANSGIENVKFIQFEDVINKLSHLIALSVKATLKKQRYHEQANLADLEEAYLIHLNCDSLIQFMTRIYKNQSDLLALYQLTHAVYEHAISVCNELFAVNNDSSYLQKAFYFSERNKASVLLHSLSRVHALEFAGIPDSLIDQEYNLRVDLTFFNSKYNELTAHNDSDKSSRKYYRSKWLEKTREHRELINYIEQQYPEYYELMYSTVVPSVESIQRNLLDKNTALIEYFVGDSSIYAFVITKDEYTVKEIEDLEQTLQKLTQLREMVFEMAAGKYVDDMIIAYELYQMLLQPSLEKLSGDINRLLIVPDHILGYLPYELLLTKKPEQGDRYSELGYLLRKYTVNYAYSTRLLFNKNLTQQHAKVMYGGFAPGYKQLVVSDTAGQSGDELLQIALRDGFDDLPAARESISHIAKLFDGDAYLNEAANEATFKQQAAQYNILHLAMHGLVDDHDPLYSKLIFSSVEDDREDNVLNAMELYNMKLNAELAVLGACNTAYGEIKRGEGIMSLSRAFAYAGCPSVVASLWSVPDDATGELMQNFFQELKAGKPKDEALRQAKLDYLDQNPDRLSSPFFWAGFISIGDAKPVEIHSRGTNSWVIAAIGLILLTFIFFIYQTKRLN